MWLWPWCGRHSGPAPVPKAVWRGSTSDPFAEAVALNNTARLLRFKLHMLSAVHPDVLDARITRVCGAWGVRGRHQSAQGHVARSA